MRVRRCMHKHTHSYTDTEHRHIDIHTHKCHCAVVWMVPVRIYGMCCMQMASLGAGHMH